MYNFKGLQRLPRALLRPIQYSEQYSECKVDLVATRAIPAAWAGQASQNEPRALTPEMQRTAVESSHAGQGTGRPAP